MPARADTPSSASRTRRPPWVRRTPADLAALLEETVTFMDDDPFSGFGLRSVELADRATLEPYFASLAEPLSDYTFSQLYTWRNSLRLFWKIIDGHLCVFANGTGDLTLLMPPIGDTGGDAALAGAFELMDHYNVDHKVGTDRSRVEYASAELLARFGRGSLRVEPMGADYVYDVQRMIDLTGGDLSSKRQAKNRFLRNYAHRVEPYRADLHEADCVRLLESWKDHQDASHEQEPCANAIKRAKESIATKTCLQSAETLGMRGMVVYVKEEVKEGSGFGVEGLGRGEGSTSPAFTEPRTLNPEPLPWVLKGFTFGEALGDGQSSITIEKTDLATKGLAQFIFSEFCRQHWASRPLVNVGDDWGLESLAWTKQSYRPVKMLQKYVLRRERAAMVAAA